MEEKILSLTTCVLEWGSAVLVAFVAFVIYGTLPYIMDHINYRLPPGPFPLPFIGNFADLASRKKKPWELLRDIAQKHGPIFTFYSGQFRMVVLGDARSVQDVLVHQSKVFSGRQDLMFPGFEKVECGVISANHDEWRKRRRFGVRAMRDFGMGKLTMVTKIQDEVAYLLPELQKNCGIPLNPKHLLTNCVSNVICSLVFGKRFSYGDVQFNSLTHTIDIIAARSLVSSVTLMAFPFLRHVFQSVQATDFMNLQNIVTKMVHQVVEERRLTFNPDCIRDFPDLYLKYEHEVGEEESPFNNFKSFGNFMTDMFAAGTETTSTALNWTFLYLATFPEIKDRCQREIDSVIENDRLPTVADRPKLLYIDAVMCEVLRHASIAPSAFLHSNLDNHAVIADYDIPPYTLVMYNVTAIHYDPMYWKDPERFNPDRWLSDDGKLLQHSNHFIPFGVGPRVCLGESLARVEYFIFIVAILQRFDFKLKAPVDLNDSVLGIVNAPPQYEIILHPR